MAKKLTLTVLAAMAILVFSSSAFAHSGYRGGDRYYHRDFHRGYYHRPAMIVPPCRAPVIVYPRHSYIARPIIVISF